MLHRVQHQGRLFEPSGRLPGRVRAEPVVREAGIRGAVLQAVLKQLHLGVTCGSYNIISGEGLLRNISGESGGQAPSIRPNFTISVKCTRP